MHACVHSSSSDEPVSGTVSADVSADVAQVLVRACTFGKV